ncbi:MAG: hypothetical protein KDH96_11900 [Candidatus Riesia sp.]|nr:hypothetical protein [Candidatus Riesia sp.]
MLTQEYYDSIEYKIRENKDLINKSLYKIIQLNEPVTFIVNNEHFILSYKDGTYTLFNTDFANQYMQFNKIEDYLEINFIDSIELFHFMHNLISELRK